jgi:hypothetical protein
MRALIGIALVNLPSWGMLRAVTSTTTTQLTRLRAMYYAFSRKMHYHA